MSTQSEFTILAEEEIDDDLTLLLARGEGVPRLGIFNTNSNKKKYVPLSWIEGAERSLKIKVGKNTKEYPMHTVVEGVYALINAAADALSLNSLAWRGVQLLGDMIHIPKVARSETDLTLIAENKKETLWYVYTPRKGDWKARPCFIPAEAERVAFEHNVVDGKPWPGILLDNGNLPATMRNLHAVKEITLSNPARWTEFMLPISKAMLLGFSDWSANGEHKFGDVLWKHLPKQNFRSEEPMNEIIGASKPFMAKLIAYLRMWPVLEQITLELVPDAAKVGEERGLKKRERFEMVAADQGDKRFKVTRMLDEGNIAAFGIEPDTRLPGENDRLVSMPEAAWNQCTEALSMGAEHDPQYTCISVLGALQTRDWYRRIAMCLAGESPEEGKGEE